jgi:hypothetical protein
MSYQLRILSLGAGVQSTAIFLMRLPFGEVQKHSMIITGLEDEL